MNTDLQQQGFLHRFLQIAASLPETLAIHHLDDDVHLTYAQLRDQAEQINGALESLQVAPGMRVLLFLPNGIALVACYLATIGRGAIPVLLNDKLTEREFTLLTKDAAPVVVLTSGALLAKRGAAMAQLASLRAVVAVDALPAALPRLPFALHTLAEMQAAPLALQAPEGNPVATIQYTYKGLGEPLAVAHRYLSLTASSDGLHQHLHQQGPGSVHLVALPLYAVFGLTVLMVMPLSLGATMLITNSLPRYNIADTLAKHKVSFACLVPDLIRLFIGQLLKRKVPLPQLEPKLMIYSGGSYLSPDVAEELGSLLGQPPIGQGFGLTECLPIMLQSAIAPRKPGSIGQPVSGVEMRIINDSGEDVPNGCTGELIVAGPTVAGEYLGKPHASARFFRNGWLHTGDLVWRDADGHVFFVGRRLRITKITAQMVDLTEVEQVAASHPDVQRARVRVVRDEQGRNSLVLNVDCNSGQTSEALLGYMKLHLSAFKLPRLVQMLTPMKEAA